MKEIIKTDLQVLKNVGPKRKKLLNRLGIYTVEDLLYHFPRRYEDRGVLKQFHRLAEGESASVAGTVTGYRDLRPRKGLTITKVAVSDGVSTGYAVWFNQPFIKRQIPLGAEIVITGKVQLKYGAIQISVTDFEIIDDQEELAHRGRIVPVYSVTEGLQPKVLRTLMKSVAERFIPLQKEFLSAELLQKYKFPGLGAALTAIHFPERLEDVEPARQRLAFEELLLMQLGVCLIRESRLRLPGVRHKKNGPLMGEFLGKLPFELTDAQQRVIDEVFQDMEGSETMNRLVQGDVGCGKTVIAAAALVKTVESGNQGVMMAPTEILAWQHFHGLREMLEPLGVQIAILTGSLGKNERKRFLEDIRTGRVDVIVGTHAVIQEEVKFERLGLAVTDEQHRFGVRQRAMLKEKGRNPDLLVMTATPIPRTLALTVYGDLDISVLDQMPPGRRPVKTYYVSEQMKDRVYRFIRRQVFEGRQVYYVCPLVEESENLDSSAVLELADILQNQTFPELRVGLLHGRMKQEAKEAVMKSFKTGSIDILVATTIIEVGVNVPNATLIVIENADRFGLAQLHQLRGRVGRGAEQSYCILVANPGTVEGQARMKVMESTSDGFVIAEEDLKLRGPGEFFGTRQSGMPDMKIADLIRDLKILQWARMEARELLKNDPGLELPENEGLRHKVIDKFRAGDNLIP